MDGPTRFLERLDDPSLGSEDLESIVATAIAAIGNTASDIDFARIMFKCMWIDVLGKAAARSDPAVERLVEALADDEGYDVGASPYDSYWERVSDRALSALYLLDVRARALPFVLRLLETTQSPHGRKNAARVLGWIGPAAKEAIPLLQSFIDDPDVEVRASARTAIEHINASA